MSICNEIFGGWTAEPAVNWMNTVYGSVNINAIDVIFPSGSIDPWHSLGITAEMTTLSEPSLTPLYIVGTEYNLDIF